MMNFIQGIGGFLLGLAVVPTVAWLCFVYPFANVSLKCLWWGIAAGMAVSTTALFVVGAYVAQLFIPRG